MKLKIKNIPITTILMAIIFAIGILLFVGAYSKKGAFSQIDILGNRKINVESQVKDTDNDGLKDWEENLYKTDYLNPDTDGDGYLDGEEVNSGHNPLVQAPNDTEYFHPLPLGDRYNVTKKVLDTDVLDSILTSYISQKNEYVQDNDISSQEMFANTVEKSTIEEMSRRAMADAYPVLMEKAQETILEMPEIFTINITDKDIKISENNELGNIKAYVSQISSILKSNTFFLQEQSLSAVSAAFNDGDFSKVDAIIKDNDAKIEQAKEIIVPTTWQEIHKEGLALTFLIRNIFVSFRDIQNDPLKAYIALQKLEKFPNQWNDLMKRAINLAKQQGVELSL